MPQSDQREIKTYGDAVTESGLDHPFQETLTLVPHIEAAQMYHSLIGRLPVPTLDVTPSRAVYPCDIDKAGRV